MRTIMRRVAVAATVLLALVATNAVVAPPAFAVAMKTNRVILNGADWLGGDGVNVYSNDGNFDSNMADTNYVNGVQSGYRWQCVELVNRLYLTRGWTSTWWSGNGYQMLDSAPAHLAKSANGAIQAINPGDVIVLGGGWLNFGHVAIVSGVTGTTIHTVSQNLSTANDGVGGDFTWNQSAKTITPWSGYSMTGVVHAPNGGASAGNGGTPPGLGSKIASARHADGRLAVFYIGANSAIYYRNQNSPGSIGWTSEIHIPAYAKAIAAVTNAQGRIELFYIGANNGLYHRWQPWTNTDQWSPEEYFSANIRAIAAANNGNGILAVIAVGSDNQLYIMQQPAPNSWNGQWHNIPAQSVDIAMATAHDGRNELFHVGTNYQTYHRWEWSPGCCWSSPEEVWGTNVRKLAATRNADGRMEVFAIGSNAQIYNNWQQQAGSNWANTWPLIPAQARYIAAATNVDGRLEIFYVGANNSVYHRRQTQAGCCWGPEDILPANVAP
ncbi:MAG TPA: CHAP domain-containing protein [Candidatus Saccharimonadales bacterium]|nr:CHAP domain-containing protein [Candidatus Saccharimonadales bacterium]